MLQPVFLFRKWWSGCCSLTLSTFQRMNFVHDSDEIVSDQKLAALINHFHLVSSDPCMLDMIPEKYQFSFHIFVYERVTCRFSQTRTRQQTMQDPNNPDYLV